MIDAFLRTAPEGWRPIACRWLRWLRLCPDAGTHAWSSTRRARPEAGADSGRGAGLDPGRWWEQVCAADWETRVGAAHCLTLAAHEHRAPDWDQADRVWLWRLVTVAGYLPRPWERHRLAEDTDPDPAAVVVNELTTAGPFGTTDEFVELLHASDQTVALNGWELVACLSPSTSPLGRGVRAKGPDTSGWAASAGPCRLRRQRPAVGGWHLRC